MPETKSVKERKHDDAEPVVERTDGRSSPGSGEDDDEAADLQPDDVENGGTAR